MAASSSTTERLAAVLREVQGALDESRRAAAEARERDAELAVQAEAERAAHAQREAALLTANAQLLERVEELSATVAKLQAQASGVEWSGVLALPSRARARLLLPLSPRLALPPASPCPAGGRDDAQPERSAEVRGEAARLAARRRAHVTQRGAPLASGAGQKRCLRRAAGGGGSGGGGGCSGGGVGGRRARRKVRWQLVVYLAHGHGPARAGLQRNAPGGHSCTLHGKVTPLGSEGGAWRASTGGSTLGRPVRALLVHPPRVESCSSPRDAVRVRCHLRSVVSHRRKTSAVLFGRRAEFLD
jgi:hypothetical protein